MIRYATCPTCNQSSPDFECDAAASLHGPPMSATGVKTITSVVVSLVQTRKVFVMAQVLVNLRLDEKDKKARKRSSGILACARI